MHDEIKIVSTQFSPQNDASNNKDISIHSTHTLYDSIIKNKKLHSARAMRSIFDTSTESPEKLLRSQAHSFHLLRKRAYEEQSQQLTRTGNFVLDHSPKNQYTNTDENLYHDTVSPIRPGVNKRHRRNLGIASSIFEPSTRENDGFPHESTHKAPLHTSPASRDISDYIQSKPLATSSDPLSRDKVDLYKRVHIKTTDHLLTSNFELIHEALRPSQLPRLGNREYPDDPIENSCQSQDLQFKPSNHQFELSTEPLFQSRNDFNMFDFLYKNKWFKELGSFIKNDEICDVNQDTEFAYPNLSPLSSAEIMREYKNIEKFIKSRRKSYSSEESRKSYNKKIRPMNGGLLSRYRKLISKTNYQNHCISCELANIKFTGIGDNSNVGIKGSKVKPSPLNKSYSKISVKQLNLYKIFDLTSLFANPDNAMGDLEKKSTLCSPEIHELRHRMPSDISQTNIFTALETYQIQFAIFQHMHTVTHLSNALIIYGTLKSFTSSDTVEFQNVFLLIKDAQSFLDEDLKTRHCLKDQQESSRISSKLYYPLLIFFYPPILVANKTPIISPTMIINYSN